MAKGGIWTFPQHVPIVFYNKGQRPVRWVKSAHQNGTVLGVISDVVGLVGKKQGISI
jgi:hypothetical protein